jgi:hypothetical protein
VSNIKTQTHAMDCNRKIVTKEKKLMPEAKMITIDV